MSGLRPSAPFQNSGWWSSLLFYERALDIRWQIDYKARKAELAIIISYLKIECEKIAPN